jgi:hypothetical protein
MFKMSAIVCVIVHIIWYLQFLNCAPNLSSSSPPPQPQPMLSINSGQSVLKVSLALGFAIILLLLNMLRRSRGEGMASLNDQQFLDFFYNELTLSNFKNIIKSESDAIRYCTLAGILPSIDSPHPHCPTHKLNHEN